MIYSNYIESMIPYGFNYKGSHYTWNEIDLVYWNDDVDDEFYYYYEIPKGAKLDGNNRLNES